MKNFTHLGHCFLPRSCLNRGSLELSVVAESRVMFDGETHQGKMTGQRRCHLLCVHRQTVQHRVRLATGGVQESLRGARSVTSKQLMMTISAREDTGSCYGQDKRTATMQDVDNLMTARLSFATSVFK